MDSVSKTRVSRRSFVMGGLGLLAATPALALGNGGTDVEIVLNDTESDRFANIPADFLVSKMRVHFATPYHINNQDAIVIEMESTKGETRYILIDGGVGPETGLDHPGYPNRYKDGSGYTNEGFVVSYERTMAYLRSLGLNSENIAFYMGTHPHLDHMGATAEILREFRPKVVYTPEYSDMYLVPSKGTYLNPNGVVTSGDNLMDSQYLYDRTIEAANEIGAHVINSVMSEDDASFTFGGLNFYIINWDSDYRERVGNDRITCVNDMSWGLFVEGCGRKIFLGGDINSYFGSEQRMTEWLRAQYGDDANIDLYKLNHHGYYGSNPESIMSVANPKIIVHTSARTTPFYKLSGYAPSIKRGSRIFATTDAGVRSMPSIIVTMDRDNLTTNLDGTVTTYGNTGAGDIIYQDGRPAKTGWINANNHWYYSNNGQFLRGWQKLNGKYWYFTKWGYVQFGWVQNNSDYYYMKDDGNWAANETVKYGNALYVFGADGKCVVNGWAIVKDGFGYVAGYGQRYGSKYYAGADGKCVVNNWAKIDGLWHWFDANGRLTLDSWLQYDGKWYYLDSDGCPLANQWMTYAGTQYWFNASGVCTKVK